MPNPRWHRTLQADQANGEWRMVKKPDEGTLTRLGLVKQSAAPVVLRNVKHHSASVRKTISSFDEVSGRLTVMGYRYVTGQGPLFLENTGGSLPAGLATRLRTLRSS